MPDIVHKTPPPDFDGDGMADLALALGSMCGENCMWRLYLTRGACSVYAGSVFGEFEPKPEKNNGAFDLFVTSTGGCGGAERGESVFRFDGHEYVESASRSCSCPADDRDPEIENCEAWRSR